MSETMLAALFKAPHKVIVQTVPRPKILNPRDAIVKVEYTGVCGSDLHSYRGIEPCEVDTIMGHEFYGTIVEKGVGITTLSIGDKVISPFTTSCSGFSSRCVESTLFGTKTLPGAQAQFVRVSCADGSLVKAFEGGDIKKLVLMADVLPTGFFAASSAFSLSRTNEHLASSKTSAKPTIALLGCGPVGLCALISALSLLQPGVLFAIDRVPERLELAKKLGATPLNLAKLGEDGVLSTIKDATEGRGADIVLEIVGARAAAELGFSALRPFGTFISVGVHVEDFPWNMEQAYDKNARVQFGRCPVRSIFQAALAFLNENTEKFNLLTESTIIMPLSEASKAYELFEKQGAQKIILKT